MQKVHSRSAGCDAYMQELNVVVLYAVLFVLSWLSGKLMHAEKAGYDDVFCYGHILQSVLIFIDLHGSIAAERLN